MQPPQWIPPTAAVRELQALERHLDDLKLMRQQTTNRLQSALQTPIILEHLQAQLALLDEQLKKTKQAILAHVNACPELKEQTTLLCSIPGLGVQTIAKLIAECRDLRAFTDAGQLVAFAGLNPRQRESGKTVVKQTIISRVGSASLRAALYMPAVSALQHNPIIRDFVARLRRRGVRGKAVVVAAMRKLLHLVVGVLKSGRPFDPNYIGSV
jgi:transposase